MMTESRYIALRIGELNQREKVMRAYPHIPAANVEARAIAHQLGFLQRELEKHQRKISGDPTK